MATIKQPDGTYNRTVPTQQPTTITSPEGTPTSLQAARDRCKARGGVWDEATRTCKIERKPVGAGGSINTEAERQATGQVGDTERQNLRVAAGIETSGTQLLEAKKQELEQAQIIEAERTRLTEEESPQRTEILNQPSGLEQVPVLGPLLSKVFDLIPFQDEAAKSKLTIDPIEQRTAALTLISEQEIERGLTNNEKFGEWVEAIPIVGSLTAKYASGLIETPSSNTREITANVLAERRRLTNIETNVKLGYMSIATAQEQVNDIEENIVRLETRMKLLINNSPQLKFNSDGVNTIETKILQTKEKILQAKQNILTGQTNDPTELQMLQQLSMTEEAE